MALLLRASTADREAQPPLPLQLSCTLLIAILMEPRPVHAPTPPMYVPAALPKLQLTPDNALDMFGTPVGGGGANGSRALLDEQELAGDPASGHGGDVVYPYMPGYQKWEYSGSYGSGGQGLQALIDLRSVHSVSDLWIYHHNGYAEATLEIFAESPFDESPVWRHMINTTQDAVTKKPVAPPPVCTGWGYAQRWCGWNISKTEAGSPKGRYIVLTLMAPASYYELVVYGKHHGAPPPPLGPPPPPPPLPPMSTFIGINSFVTEPLSRQVAAGSIREYHDWVWDEGTDDPCYPHAETKFSPDYSGFQSDPFYKTRAAAGIKTHVVLQGRPQCQFGTNSSISHWKCVDDTAMIGTSQTMDPSSYSQLAAHVYQYVARYGRVKVPDKNLALAVGQPRVSGAGWLDGIEVRNEPNGYWAGQEAYMTPVEQAALLSACFDGHEGTVGINKDIISARKADPSVLVSMGGLSGATQVALDNVAVMRLWFQAKRKDKRFAADALNFHFYCNDDQTSKGASPEECDFEGVMLKLTAWRDSNEPHLQVWLTEFGYDTSPLSPNLAPQYSSFDAEAVQGMWLIRSYMYMAMARVDRAHMFMLADSHDNGGQKFMTSGLTSSKTSNYTPKKSWYFVSTMIGVLRDMRFAGEAYPSMKQECQGELERVCGIARRTSAAKCFLCTGTHQQEMLQANCSATDFRAYCNRRVPKAQHTGAGSAARIVTFRRDVGISKTGPEAAFVFWLGTKTGATAQISIDIGATAAAAVLVQLSSNSTNGLQSALPITSGKVTVTVSEMPAFVLVGEGLLPQPPNGPVPPVDPPVAAACANLPIGLHCTGTGTYNGSFIVCPQGEADACANGDQCEQESPGVIECKPNPTSLCANKPMGMYCDPSAKRNGWPDPYVECPKLEQLYCPSATPVCKQTGDTVTCEKAQR